MSKTVAILQSNYIPWKGYFDLIHQVDEFVIYDVVQYTKNDWRNRNQIKTTQGVQWLTIPVRVNGLNQRINETTVSTPQWAKKHWRTLSQAYAKAPFFKHYRDELEALYAKASQEPLLSRINMLFITAINRWLGISTVIRQADEFNLPEDRNDRLLFLCQTLQASRYISGPAAQDYLDETRFTQAGIDVSWMHYGPYREYPQPHGVFVHAVTVLDLLFHTGPDALRYLAATEGNPHSTD